MIDESQFVTGWCPPEEDECAEYWCLDDGAPPGYISEDSCGEGFTLQCVADPAEYPIAPPGQFDCLLESTAQYSSGIMFYGNTGWHGIQTGSNGVGNDIVDKDLNRVFFYGDASGLPSVGGGNKTRYPYVSQDLILYTGSDIANAPNPKGIFVARRNQVTGIFEVLDFNHFNVAGTTHFLANGQSTTVSLVDDGIALVGGKAYINSIAIIGIFRYNFLSELIDYISISWTDGSPNVNYIQGMIWACENNGTIGKLYDGNGSYIKTLEPTPVTYGANYIDLGNYGGVDLVVKRAVYSVDATVLYLYNYAGTLVATLESPLAYKNYFGNGISRAGNFLLITQDRVSDLGVLYGITHLFDTQFNFIKSYNFLIGQDTTQFFEVTDCILTADKIMGRDSKNDTYQMTCKTSFIEPTP